MSKRIKPDKPTIVRITDWENADEHIRKIGDLQLEINQAEHTAKDKIDEAKADLAEKTKTLQEKIKLYARSLEVFAETNKDKFGKQKSKTLYFGTLGWRKSTSISIKKTTLELIKKVFSKAKAKAYIRTKETVDKESLARLTEKQLAKVGARRKIKDAFFVEPSFPGAVDYIE